MFNIPIVFLTYKRPNETKKILRIITKIKPKKLYIFQDGKKKKFNSLEIKNHNDTTKLLKKFSQYKSKKIFFKKNIGQRYIGQKILDYVFRKEKYAIILEDDCIPENGFFSFCKEMLIKYSSDRSVAHISGCNLFYGTSKKKIIKNQDYIFSKFPHFMGWATWKNRWKKYYDPEIKDWPANRDHFLNNCNLKTGERRFFKYYLDKIYDGKQIAWDTQWVYYNIFNNFKTIVPNVNLIKNIGFYNAPTGKGAKKFRNLKTKNILLPIKHNSDVAFCKDYDNFLYNSFYNRKNIIKRIYNRIKYSTKPLISFYKT